MIVINRATIKDLKPLAVQLNNYRVFYKQESNLNACQEFLAERLTNQDSIIFVALVSDKLIGFTQLYPLFSSVKLKTRFILNDLYVDQDFRKIGVAAKLMEKAEDFAKDVGAKGIILNTANKNIPAQKLYEKRGWVKETQFCSYYFNF